MSIGFSHVPASAAASAVFVEQENVRRGVGATLTHKVLIIGQYNSGFTPTDNQPQYLTGLADAQARYGRGSMLARAAEKAFLSGGVGYEVHALPVADAPAGVAASGDIVVTGAATEQGVLALTIGGDEVDVPVAKDDNADTIGGAIEAAINAKADLPVTASNSTGTVTITAKFAGAAGNQISMHINRSAGDKTPAGVALTIDGSLSSGATNPDIATALAGLGDEWYTEVVCPYLDNASIAAIEAAGVSRMDPGTKRPFLAFVGYTDSRSNLLTALEDRNSEFVSFVPVHGSPTTAFEIGASFAAMWAKHHAGDKIGRPVFGNTIPGVRAGDDNDLTYSVKDAGIKSGASYTVNSGSSVLAGDTATTRTETNAGVETDSWRFAIIIPNLQYKINAADITFGSSPFQQAVVISDDAPGAPPYAVRPKTAKGYAVKLVDDWVAKGLTADRESVVSGIVAQINEGNAGRIDVMIPDIPSAGLRVLAAKIEWDFIV